MLKYLFCNFFFMNLKVNIYSVYQKGATFSFSIFVINNPLI